MAHREPFAETVTRFETPPHRHLLIRAPNGGFLGTADGHELAVYDHVDDKAVWDVTADGYRHVGELQVSPCSRTAHPRLANGRRARAADWHRHVNSESKH